MFELILAFSVFIVGMVAADLHFGSAEAKRSMRYVQDAHWDHGL